MKYSEFKREIEAMGLITITEKGFVEVLDKYGEMLLSVDMEYNFSICTDYFKFDKLDKEIKKELFYLAVELASTPLQEREDEKRYRLKLPFLDRLSYYLNRAKDDENQLFLSSREESVYYQTVFTESEITDLKQKYNLDSFVLEEVKEDE